MPLTARAYLSPTLVLLAFDYPEGKNIRDFLGFAIKRTPGFNGAPFTYLPNLIGFNGPDPTGVTHGSDAHPIQKFYWWDSQINTAYRGSTFSYAITVATGDASIVTLAGNPTVTVDVTIPLEVVDGIGTYFNRAVVGSQSFVREFGRNPSGDLLHKAFQWLGNV